MSGSTAAPGLIIAAPASGAGKTTVTLGLLRALAGAGTEVAPERAQLTREDVHGHRSDAVEGLFKPTLGEFESAVQTPPPNSR